MGGSSPSHLPILQYHTDFIPYSPLWASSVVPHDHFSRLPFKSPLHLAHKAARSPPLTQNTTFSFSSLVHQLCVFLNTHFTTHLSQYRLIKYLVSELHRDIHLPVLAVICRLSNTKSPSLVRPLSSQPTVILPFHLPPPQISHEFWSFQRGFQRQNLEPQVPLVSLFSTRATIEYTLTSIFSHSFGVLPTSQ